MTRLPRVLFVSIAPSLHTEFWAAGFMKALRKVAVPLAFPFRKMAHDHGAAYMNETLVETALEFRPDLIFIRKGESILGSSIKTLRDSLPAYIIYYCGDFRLNPVSFIVDIGRYADCTIFNNEDEKVADRYQVAGVRHVGPWWDGGIDPEVFCPQDVPRAWDLAFMGTNVPLPHRGYQVRRQLLEAIVESNYSLHIFGGAEGWKYLHTNTHPFVYGPAFAKACSQSRITLGVNGVNDMYLYASWQRTFKSMASGAFHLTHYVPGLETFFENRKHLVWFISIPEAMSLIAYYLTHDEEREEIAMAGRQEVLAHFTWDDAVARLMRIWQSDCC